MGEEIKTTVFAFIEHVELTRRQPGGSSVAEAFLVLADDADDHKFKVAVPREFAQKIGEYLATWDESDRAPRIAITFSIEDEEEQS